MGGANSPIQKCRSSRPSTAIAPMRRYLHHGPLLPPLTKHERSERLATTPDQFSAVQRATSPPIIRQSAQIETELANFLKASPTLAHHVARWQSEA
jgi:hypothetical protein